MNSKRIIFLKEVVILLTFLLMAITLSDLTMASDLNSNNPIFCGGAFDAFYPNSFTIQNSASKATPFFSPNIKFGEESVFVQMKSNERSLTFQLVDSLSTTLEEKTNRDISYVEYEDALPNIDIRYKVDKQNVKEYIILKNKETPTI